MRSGRSAACQIQPPPICSRCSRYIRQSLDGYGSVSGSSFSSTTRTFCMKRNAPSKKHQLRQSLFLRCLDPFFKAQAISDTPHSDTDWAYS